MEENLLAILDSASDSKHTPDANDDRIGFLEAARSSCTQSVRGGVSNSEGWEILGIDYSRLLNELDNRYPGVYLSGKEASRPLVVAEASSRESGAGGTSISRPLNSLSSRRANYKGLMKDCLCIMCRLFEVSAGISESLEPPDNSVSKTISQWQYCFSICNQS